MKAPYVIIESPRLGTVAIHHESWGKQWVTLKRNGTVDIHERAVEREPVRTVKEVRA